MRRAGSITSADGFQIFRLPQHRRESCQLGPPTTTRFTRTRLSDIVRPVSSSQLTQEPDRVRSLGATTESHVALLITANEGWNERASVLLPVLYGIFPSISS